MNFHDWYREKILPFIGADFVQYEEESVMFRELDKLTKEEAQQLLLSMSEAELKLVLFDHVKHCVEEAWVPGESVDGFEEE